jgi:hypothetical protein
MINKRGSILIFVYSVIFVLLSLSASVIAHSIQEKRAFEITKDKSAAFYLAETSLDNALAVLMSNQNYAGTTSPVSVYRGTTLVGQYEATVDNISSNLRKITVTSYVPQETVAPGEVRQMAKAEAVARIATTPPPANFYDYAIYSAGEIEFTQQGGNNPLVTGDVIYADSISSGNVSGTKTHDATISPLTHLSFQDLRNKAQSQFNAHTIAHNNIYTTADLAAKAAFPADFYYNSIPGGEPNVVYVEGDLTLKGNITTGGFFIVVGNILVDPTVTSDTTINGNVAVSGCIYSTGEFTLNGGGNALNVDGGIWAGEEAEFKGATEVQYNATYMNVVKNLVDSLSSVTVQLLSWRQLELYD